MKSLVLVAFLSLSLVSYVELASAEAKSAASKKTKAEPTPKDDRSDDDQGTYEENYEGNDREGAFDGGGYEGGGEAGSVLFSAKFKLNLDKPNTTIEDRGDVLVYTSTVQEDIDASETCTTVTETVVDKKTGKVISEDSEEFCNNWPL